MTHVSLDAQDDAVKRFVMSLSTNSAGSVLELAGKPVVCVVPPPQKNGFASDSEWTTENDRRRVALINRKCDAGLSPSEEAELGLLQDAFFRRIDELAPLPIEAAGNLHETLVKKAAKARARSNS